MSTAWQKLTNYPIAPGLSVITLSLLHPIQATPVQNWTFESETSVRIGRSNDNDVVVYSAVVSRHHVEMKLTAAGWEINSLGANGTYVNQERVTSLKALDGMVMRLGSTGPKIQISLGPLASHLVGKTVTAKKAQATQTPDPAARIKTFLTEPKTATTHSDSADRLDEDEDTTQFNT